MEQKDIVLNIHLKRCLAHRAKPQNEQNNSVRKNTSEINIYWYNNQIDSLHFPISEI